MPEERKVNLDESLKEQLVKLKRVSRAVKGGRRISFSAFSVVGDGQGCAGYGFGKADDVAEAIRKSMEQAKKNLFRIPLSKHTIPHTVQGKFKSSSVLLKPAAPGTGIIAGGAVRIVMEAAGVRDVLAKSLGCNNTINMVKSVFKGFSELFDVKKLAAERGKSVAEIWGIKKNG